MPDAQPERERFTLTHHELVEALIKKHGLHEGVWRLYVEFRLAGVNAGPSEAEIMPAAVVGIQRIGIIRGTTEDGISVDAAIVNPAPAGRQPKRKAKAGTTSRERPSAQSASAS